MSRGFENTGFGRTDGWRRPQPPWSLGVGRLVGRSEGKSGRVQSRSRFGQPDWFPVVGQTGDRAEVGWVRS